MHIRSIRRTAAVVASAGTGLGTAAVASAAAQPGQGGGGGRPSRIQHGRRTSVDGMHQQDLTWYVKNFPNSTLASLDRRGIEYRDARTPFPSDSFPGMVGQVTGGDPRVTGIYYDDTWNHDVFPAGTTNCSGPVPGGEVPYHEADDIDQTRLDAGQGLAGLPGSILQMTRDPRHGITPA